MSYPSTIDDFREVTNRPGRVYDPLLTTRLFAEDINAITEAIEAIETELGTDPAGTKATVDARLDSIETANGIIAEAVQDHIDNTYNPHNTHDYKTIFLTPQASSPKSATLQKTVSGTNFGYDTLLFADGLTKEASWQFVAPGNISGNATIRIYFLLGSNTNKNIRLQLAVIGENTDDPFDQTLSNILALGNYAYGGAGYTAGDIYYYEFTYNLTAYDDKFTILRLRRYAGDSGDTVDQDVNCLGVSLKFPTLSSD